MRSSPGSSELERGRSRAKTRSPPLERNEPQGDLERSPVKLLGQLHDGDKTVCERLVVMASTKAPGCLVRPRSRVDTHR